MNDNDANGDARPRAVYRGAELFERLRKHESEAVENNDYSSTAECRMAEFARHVGLMDIEACDPEALYQVAVWTLLKNSRLFIREENGSASLAAAARRGHHGARFILAKGVADGIWWAIDEMRYLASDGNAESLARSWLSEQVTAGYEDAKLVLACLEWIAGKQEEADALFEWIGDSLPEAKIHQGVFLLATSTERGISLIDDGERMVSTSGSVLKELEKALMESAECAGCAA